MILVDTGPCVALFDPRDAQHERCKKVLRTIRETLQTTIPVLTEAFHMLSPESQGSDRLRDFVLEGGLSVWFMSNGSLRRAFELMEKYGDRPMDLADASLIVAAEELRTRKIFTVDRNDFATYRIRSGHRYYGCEIIP
jgi:predicted nucleic acid-binding protein